MEAISREVKEYLRSRKDTIRCVVTSFTMDSGSELYEELGRADARLLEQDDDSDDEDAGFL